MFSALPVRSVRLWIKGDIKERTRNRYHLSDELGFTFGDRA
jgi:hypothetical protein